MHTAAIVRRANKSHPAWFDPWLVAAPSGPLRQLVTGILNELIIEERNEPTRQRGRRPADQAAHEQRVEVVVCNLVNAALTMPVAGRLGVLLGTVSSSSRYDNGAVYGRPFIPLLVTLRDMGLLELGISRARGTASYVSPTEAFANEVRSLGITVHGYIRQSDGQELIILQNGRSRADRVEYADTKATRRMRAQMKRLNAFLAAADIRGGSDGQPLTNRRLRRIFKPTDGHNFNQHGRLYASWQNLPATDRPAWRINGERVVSLDYGQMFTRLAYADLGLPVPNVSDVYTIPGFERHRDGLKVAMNALLFDDRRRQGWPEAAELPPGTTVKSLKAAIRKVHPDLPAAWGRCAARQSR
jgi:hypothetical protein